MNLYPQIQLRDDQQPFDKTVIAKPARQQAG
jgi:hypothetical protein